jgi:hypothetical protein
MIDHSAGAVRIDLPAQIVAPESNRRHAKFRVTYIALFHALSFPELSIPGAFDAHQWP